MSAKKKYPMENTYVSSMFAPTCVFLVAQIAGCLPKKDPLQNTRVSSMFYLPPSFSKFVLQDVYTKKRSHARHAHFLNVSLSPYFGELRCQDVSQKTIPCKTCTFPRCFPWVHNLGSSDFRMSPKRWSHARHAPFLNVFPESIIWGAQISGWVPKKYPMQDMHVSSMFPLRP